ncbi:MAG TPA: hypothetical protein VE957_07255 [Terriglobales bacterium]|nr:hypothetical protein [Terriglobales bacterium]
MQYDLKKYERAFELLGEGGNWKTQVPDFARHVMVFIALNLDYKKNTNIAPLANLIGSNSGFKQNDSAVLMCLNEIKKVGG